MKKTVIAFGTFDILHPGHIRYLEGARRLGDRLVVVIAKDESVKLFKKRRPIMNEKDRMLMIGSLRIVDIAILGARLKKSGDAYSVFLRYKPDVIALGYDQPANIAEIKKWLSRHKINAKVVRLKKQLRGKMYKSTNIKKIIAGSVSG